LPTVRSLRLAVVALVIATGPGASLATSANSPSSARYTLSARALLGPAGTDVYVTVSRDAEPTPALFDKVKLKARPLATGEVQTRNFFDVPAPGGVATLHLDGLVRAQRVEVSAHVKDGPQNNLETEAFVRRRPDLVVRDVIVPSDVTRRQTFDVRIVVAEADDDTGATAVVTLSDGITELGQQLVSVGAGAQTDVAFGISLPTHGHHQLRATISGADPFESDATNNVGTADLYAHRYLADGVVSTEDSAATGAGVQVLRAGGNAFDAAAAVLFALNVTEAHLAGIGGAANIVVQLADGRRYAIDGRETAPAATTPDMYKGLPDVGLNGFAVGVPGALRAVDEMLDRWGTMSVGQTLGPAIRLAEDGITVGAFLANDARSTRVPRMTPELQAVFRPGGVPVAEGDILKQPDLARTFKLIAAQGDSVFYRGEIAQAIVAAQHWKSIPQGEGRMTLADLAGYDVRVEEPLSIDYGGYTVLGAPPSTCGGLVVLEALGLIDHFRQANPGYPWQFGTPETLHVMIDALRLAYADRDMWIGDDDFFAVPAAGLLSDAYLTARSALITPGYAGNPHAAIPGTPPAGNPFPFATTTAVASESVTEDASTDSHTTHFSVLDKWGNAVVFTATVTDSFGSGILVPGYGFALNDTSVNFNATPAADPATGNPGANDAAPGKRARGNTAPTLLVRGAEPVVGTGSLGAAFIPSIVLNVVLNAVDFGMPIQQAVDAPRIWSQDKGGAAAVNPGLSPAIEPVRALGHMLPWAGNLARMTSGGASLGSANSFAVGGDTVTLSGAADAARHPDATAVVLTRP
jgi:gamma-glutamyltranspeptidase / glutathione hydrolase